MKKTIEVICVVAQTVILYILYCKQNLLKNNFLKKLPGGTCLASRVRCVRDFCVCVWLCLSQPHCLLAQQEETSAPKNPECRLFLPQILEGRSIIEGVIHYTLSLWFLIQRKYRNNLTLWSGLSAGSLTRDIYAPGDVLPSLFHGTYQGNQPTSMCHKADPSQCLVELRPDPQPLTS